MTRSVPATQVSDTQLDDSLPPVLGSGGATASAPADTPSASELEAAVTDDLDRKSTRLSFSHSDRSRMPSSA